MKNIQRKKGFTLIELLGVVILLGILLLIAVPSISKYLKIGTNRYYHSLESEMKATGMDYLETYRTLMPRQIGHVTVLDLGELVVNNYIDEVVDENGNLCEGRVTVKKTKTDSYEYYSCLVCDNYKTEGEACTFNEDDNEYIDSEDYEVVLDPDYYIVYQTEEFELPVAQVKYKGELISETVTGRPNKVDTNKLGKTKIRYTYHGAVKTITVEVVDIVPPSSPEVVLKHDNDNGTSYLGEWYSGDIYQKFKSTDYTKPGILGSGISHYLVSDDGKNYRVLTGDYEINTENGIYTKYVKAVDNSKNSSGEPATSYTFKIDKEAPTCDLSVTSGTKGENDWYISDVTVGWASGYPYDGVSNVVSQSIFQQNKTSNSGTNSIKVTDEGDNIKIIGTVIDEAGNIGTCHKIIKIDKTKPTISIKPEGLDLTVTPPKGIYKTNQTATIIAEDDYFDTLITSTTKNDTPVDADTSKTKTKQYTLTHGEWIVEATAKDEAGNETKLTEEYLIDTVPPECTINVTSGTKGNEVNNKQWYLSDVTVSLSSTDGTGSNITSQSIYQKNKTSNSGTNSIKVTDEGSEIIIIGSVTDQAGHVNSCTKTISIDKTKPTVSIKPDSGKYNTDQTVTIITRDDYLYSSETKTTKDQTIVNNDITKASTSTTELTKQYTLTHGKWIVEVVAIDEAGNETKLLDSNGNLYEYLIDTEPPTCDLVVTSGTEGENNWYISDVTIGWKETPNGTGSSIISQSISQDNNQSNIGTNSITVADEGRNIKINGSVTDEVGNVASCQIIVNIDKTYPVLVMTPPSGVYNTNQTVTIIAEDDYFSSLETSTIKDGISVNYDITTSSKTKQYELTAGNWMVSAVTKDEAGHETKLSINPYQIDPNPPECKLVTSGTLGEDGGYISDVTVTWADGYPKDEVSSITSKSIYQKNKTSNSGTDNILVTDEGENITVVGTVTDEVGNVGTCSSEIPKIDKTKPTVNYNLSGGTYNEHKTVRVTAADTYFKEMNVIVTKNGIEQTNSTITTNTYDVSLNSDGEWIIYTKVKDQSGWTQDQEPEDDNGYYYQTYIIDAEKPACSFTVTGTEGQNNWYTSDITVGLTIDNNGGSEVVSQNYTVKDTDGNIITSKTTEQTSITTEGMYTVEGTIKNSQNEEITCTDTIKIDKTKPTLTITPYKGNYNTEQDVKITATDDNLESLYTTITKDGTLADVKESMGLGGVFTTLTQEYTLTDGKWIVETIVSDIAGNTTSLTYDYSIDTVIPTCSFVVSEGTLGNNGWYISENVKLDLVKEDDDIVSYSAEAIEIEGENLFNGEDSVTISEDGKYDIKGIVTDSNGNVGTCWHVDIISIDTIAPECPLTIKNGTKKNNSSKWYTGSVTLGWLSTPTDPEGGSGIASYNITSSGSASYSGTDSITISKDGTHNVNATVTDKAGNKEECGTTIYRDSTAPSCAAEVTSGTKGTDDWYTDDVTIGWSSTPTDNEGGSGLVSYIIESSGSASYSDTDSITITTDGTHNVTAKATDDAGNSKTCYSETINKDAVAPECPLTTKSGTQGNGTWFISSSVTLGWLSTPTDATSGIASYSITSSGSADYSGTDSITISKDGTHNVIATVTDKAGNTNTCGTTIDKDSTAPICKLEKVGTLDTSGYYSTEVTVKWASGYPKDATSGVGSYSISNESSSSSDTDSVLLNEDGTYALKGTVIDNAGNSGTCEDTALVDITPPTVNISPGTITSTSNQTIAITAADNNYKNMQITITKDGTNDVNTTTSNTTYSYTTSGEGKYIVTATAYDYSGKSATTSETYLIDQTAPTCKIIINDSDLEKYTDDSIGTYYKNKVPITIKFTDEISGVYIYSTTITNEYYGLGSIAPPVIGDTNPDSNSIRVDETISENGTNTITATVTDGAGHIGSCSAEVIINVAKPKVEISLGSWNPVIWNLTHLKLRIVDDELSENEKIKTVTYEIYTNDSEKENTVNSEPFYEGDIDIDSTYKQANLPTLFTYYDAMKSGYALVKINSQNNYGIKNTQYVLVYLTSYLFNVNESVQGDDGYLYKTDISSSQYSYLTIDDKNECEICKEDCRPTYTELGIGKVQCEIEAITGGTYVDDISEGNLLLSTNIISMVGNSVDKTIAAKVEEEVDKTGATHFNLYHYIFDDASTPFSINWET